MTDIPSQQQQTAHRLPSTVYNNTVINGSGTAFIQGVRVGDAK